MKIIRGLGILYMNFILGHIFPWEFYQEIFAYAKEIGITCFSTPFDLKSVDFLEDFNVPCYKIGSSENIDLPLIEKVMRLEKPVIVSLGMANLNEIEDIIHLAESLNFKDLIFMICTCCYPAPIEEINLATIPHLREKYGINIGFSDHSLGLTAAIASVALGAVTIEKHFMLSESEDPLDECVSIDEKSLVDLVSMTKDAFKGNR